VDTKPNCNHNTTILLLEIILPIALVLLALLVLLLILFVVPRARLWCAARRGQRMVQEGDGKGEGEKENLELSQVHGYEVNSAAGKFNVQM
jgi:hypothetical protein